MGNIKDVANIATGDRFGFVAAGCVIDGNTLDGKFEIIIDSMNGKYSNVDSWEMKVRANFDGLRISSSAETAKINGDLIAEIAQVSRTSETITTFGPISEKKYSESIKYANGTVFENTLASYYANFYLSDSNFKSIMDTMSLDLLLEVGTRKNKPYELQIPLVNKEFKPQLSIRGIEYEILAPMEGGLYKIQLGIRYKEGRRPYTAGKFRLSGESSSLTVTIVGMDVFQLDFNNDPEGRSISFSKTIGYWDLKGFFR